jgi:ADP-ribose pyrophosphatase YjhB (NUDIX family)
LDVDSATPRIRVAAIIVRAGAVLAVRHDKEGRSTWLLPGGGVEYGESLTAALGRELHEETGLEIRVDRPLIMVESIAPDGSRHTISVCFEAAVAGGTLTVGGDARVVEARYVTVDELRALPFHPDIKAELIEGLQRGFGPFVHTGPRWSA